MSVKGFADVFRKADGSNLFEQLHEKATRKSSEVLMAKRCERQLDACYQSVTT